MRNPIFADTTVFLDYADQKVRYVSGKETTILSDGAKIMRLETRQPLVEIKTTGGFSFTMSPESAFALHKDEDGMLWRYAPAEYFIGNSVDWHASIDDLSARRFAVCGMIVGNGMHLHERHRVSYTVVGKLDVAFELKAFLSRLAAHYVELAIMHPNSTEVQIVEAPGGYMVKSRAITILVGKLLAEKTLTPTFDPSMLNKKMLRSFYAGLFSTAAREDGDIVVRHRDASVIRTLGEHLFYQFGVPCDILVSPMEPQVQRSLSVPQGHRFRLSAEQQKMAVLAGLIEGEKEEVSFFQRDQIEQVIPLRKRVASVIVLPGTRKWPNPLTANGFAFRSQFEIPVGIVEIASHAALLKDSSDPATFEG